MSGDNPMTRAQVAARATLPKRFYGEVQVKETEGGWQVLLDGRPVRTPKRRPLLLPDQQRAEAVAEEWTAVGEHVDPAEMPLTRLANTAIDGVADAREAVAMDAARFAGSDLLCYRADTPDGLVAAQAAVWDPLVDWARSELGMRFNLAVGVIHVDQPAETLERANALVAEFDIQELTGFHVMVSLTGSVVIPLAVSRGRLSVEEAWKASLVDEDWQIGQWGEDEEAKRRRQRNWRELQAAARFAGW